MKLPLIQLTCKGESQIEGICPRREECLRYKAELEPAFAHQHASSARRLCGQAYHQIILYKEAS